MNDCFGSAGSLVHPGISAAHPRQSARGSGAVQNLLDFPAGLDSRTAYLWKGFLTRISVQPPKPPPPIYLVVFALLRNSLTLSAISKLF